MNEPDRLARELRNKAFAWITEDVEAATREELQAVLASAMHGEPGAAADLADRMAGPLEFGTAGLRGPVRAGPNGMNTSVVVRTTAGVASWLAGQGKTGATVVVGRDARHGSDRFATAAAEVLYAAGFDVRLLPRPLPTPVLAFAVLHLGAAAGVQITASHNPPADNGYKLYDATGSQIVPPSDAEIEAAIERAPGATTVPRTPGVPTLDDSVLEAYLDRVAALATGSSGSLRVAATALHGVGAAVLRSALERAGFTDLHLVVEQEEPDPGFPTVPFPNPEEPGATDLLLELAAKVDADLAIALDPDADRCALGVRDGDSWRMLRGDEAGVVLGEHVLSTTRVPNPLVATTIVSSSMLGSIAEAHGARYEETLTGFKWLTRVGDGLVFAYEEALGLCVNPDFVRDKDGIAAAVAACDLTASLKAQGRSLLDVLDDLSRAHGVHATDQVSLRVTDLSVRERVLESVRAAPPTTLAGTPVAMTDLRPATDAVRLAGDGLRVVIRPSGTEPKLKTYLQVVEPVTAGLSEARAVAQKRLSALREDVQSLLAVPR